MKKLLLILLLTTSIYSQYGLDPFDFFAKRNVTLYSSVISIDTTTYPLTPYGNGWLVFNGRYNKQFARTSDLPQFEFIYGVTDSFRITTRIQIGYKSKPMWICGKYDGSNGSWILGFNSNAGATIEFYHTACGWKSIRVLGATDTLWYKIDIVFRKSDNQLKLYYNDTLASTTSSFTYTSGNNLYSLAVGHASMLASYSDPTTGASSQPTHFFDGKMDYLRIDKYYNNGDSLGKWDFNEGGMYPQQLYDSVTYTKIDASTPDGYRAGSHFMNGCFGSRDSQDVYVSSGIRKNSGTITSGLGTGLWNWSSSFPAYIQGFCNGLFVDANNNIIPSTTFNRVNVTDGIWTNNTDTASDVAKWNGTTWSKIGNNGSTFSGGSVTQVFGYGDTLFAGGSFTNVVSANGDYVVKFNGTNWDTCSKGFNNAVYCFQLYNGKVIAGGDFSASGSISITSSVAQWDYNVWSAIGTNDIGGVWSLEVHNGVLWAGTTQGIYYLNGTTWILVDALGGSIVYCLQSYNGELWYGGSSGKIGKVTITGITSMGTVSGFTGDITEFAVIGDDLYITGSFFRIIYNGINTVCNKLARWNGREYSAVHYGYSERPEDLAKWIYNGITYLVVNGDFYMSDGIQYNNINLVRVP